MKNNTRIKDLVKAIREHEIIRRYFIINSFDGALAIFGIILVSYLAGIRDPLLVLLPSVGASVAMCVSGMWGAYAAEDAEVTKRFKEMEKAKLKKMRISGRYAENHRMTILVAIVDGLSPLVTGFIIIIPFFLANLMMISVAQAYTYSLVLTAAVLFTLGGILGKIAKENIYKNGFKMLLAGVIIALIFYILALLGIL